MRETKTSNLYDFFGMNRRNFAGGRNSGCHESRYSRLYFKMGGIEVSGFSTDKNLALTMRGHE